MEQENSEQPTGMWQPAAASATLPVDSDSAFEILSREPHSIWDAD